MLRFLRCLEIIEILLGWKKVPFNTLIVGLLYWHLNLGCLFGNLLPFPGWFHDSPYKFIALNILSLCSVRSLCWEGFWLLLPVCSSCLSNFTDDVASLCCYSVFFALGLKRMCSETWMSAVLWSWCSDSLPVWISFGIQTQCLGVSFTHLQRNWIYFWFKKQGH